MHVWCETQLHLPKSVPTIITNIFFFIRLKISIQHKYRCKQKNKTAKIAYHNRPNTYRNHYNTSNQQPNTSTLICLNFSCYILASTFRAPRQSCILLRQQRSQKCYCFCIIRFIYKHLHHWKFTSICHKRCHIFLIHKSARNIFILKRCLQQICRCIITFYNQFLTHIKFRLKSGCKVTYFILYSKSFCYFSFYIGPVVEKVLFIKEKSVTLQIVIEVILLHVID